MPREHRVVVAGNEGVDPSFVGFAETVHLPDSLQQYAELWQHCLDASKRDYQEWRAIMRLWSAADWFFRLVFVLTAGRDAWSPWRNEPHFWHPTHLELARWCQFGDHENEFLIASRGLGKSTHLTFNDDIGHKLLDPNHASVTFSHTREFAQKHLNIKMEELRMNHLLRELWPDRFYMDPDEEATLFSLKDGINIKRSTTRMEPSFSAHAFETHLPVGMHFDKRYYDDIETDKTVESEEAMDKVESRYVASQDLSSSLREKAVCGTYYHPNGPLRRLETGYGLKPRVWSCEGPRAQRPEEAGPGGGIPINGFAKEELDKIVRDKGGRSSARAMRSYGRQNLCDPLAGETVRLNSSFIQRYTQDPVSLGAFCNIYICQDPSPGLDNPTWTWVWGLHQDRNYYWLDGWRKRVPPNRRLAETYLTCLRWNGIGNLIELRMESFGQGFSEAQAEHFRANGFRVPVIKLADSKATKREREFEAWDPPLQEGRIFFPSSMIRETELGDPVDLVAYFIDNEMRLFPLPITDDGLDAGGLLWAREKLAGGPLQWPAERKERDHEDLIGEGEAVGSAMSRGIL